MNLQDDLMDFFGTDAELQFALWRLKEITDLPECQITENGFTDNYSAHVFVCVQSIIKCKRKLGRSVLKKDKEMLEIAKKALQRHFVTLDRDEQIKVLKYVQPD